jgi:phosphoglycerol transferase MdoB-like AlkP superfamily enzyme
MQFYRQQIRVLLNRLGLIMAFYVLSRLLFIAFNTDLFPMDSAAAFARVFTAGLRFDMAAVFMTNALFILASLIPLQSFFTKGYQRFLALLYLPVNIAALIANLSDIIYVRFTLKRTTMDFTDMFADDGGLFKLLPQFVLDFWYIVLIGLLFIYLLIRGFFKQVKAKQTIGFTHSAFYWQEIITALMIVGITIIGIRGGMQLRPIGIMTASKYAGPDLAPVILNTPFTLIKSGGKQRLTEYQFFPENELKNIYNPVHAASPKAFRKLNVVVIIMESLSKEHIGFLNRDIPAYKGFTPFLDSLFAHGLICTQAYANGKRSIDGIPAVIAGLPHLMSNAYNSSIYASNKLSSLASLLKVKGYQTAFFHGGNNGTMGFDQFTRAIGYEAYYGRDEYGNDADFDGKWGIYDEPYFQYFGKQLNNFHEPFMATIFSLSAHHPYTIPEKYEGRFPEGKLPIQKCIAYSDFALRRFFEYARKQDWYERTLFVITADHCSEIAMEKYNTDWGKYAIPVFYYMPSDSLQGSYFKTTQQIDILPSVLDYLDYDRDYFAFGESIFDSAAPGFSVSYLNFNYQIIHGNQLIQTDFKTNFNYERFEVQENISQEMKPESLENFLKAFVQTYNQRMINNQLTIEADEQ